jgi:hypothetical protein
MFFSSLSPKPFGVGGTFELPKLIALDLVIDASTNRFRHCP